MNKNKKIVIILLLTCLLFNREYSIAQDNGNNPLMTMDAVTEKITQYKPGDSHFMVVGLATMGFLNETNIFTPLNGKPQSTSGNSLGDADRFEFSPMMLWRQGNKVLLEFEPSYTAGTTIGVNWADISYFAAPGVIIRGGYFVLPFGIYAKRLAAGWINKLASDPIGMDMSGADFGIEVEGGFPLGSMKWSYDIAISNGFQMDSTGVVSSIGIVSPNPNKTVSGRLGLLPLSNSSLEIGFSALGGNLYAPQSLGFNNPTLMMYAFDLSYYKRIGMFSITVKGQYNLQTINKQTFLNPTDTAHLQTYSFNNSTMANFAQFSIRPTGLENFFKNFELGYRHVMYQSPDQSLWGQNWSENDVALSYWLSWRQVLKFAYENIETSTIDNPSLGITGGTTKTNRFIFQFSTQF